MCLSAQKVGVCGPAPLRGGVWGEMELTGRWRGEDGEDGDDKMDPGWGSEGSACGAVVELDSPPAAGLGRPPRRGMSGASAEPGGPRVEAGGRWGRVAVGSPLALCSLSSYPARRRGWRGR